MNSTLNQTNHVVTEVWIPLRGYKLTLQHRLLKELGEISHFILESLHQTPLSLNDFEAITGLNEKQLNPVMKRLEGLGLIDRLGKLTSSGESIAYSIKHLHQQSIIFWLDGRYKTERNTMLMLKGDSSLVNKLPNEAFKIKPKSLERDWNSDCFSQNQRLQKSIQDVLIWLFPAFEDWPNKNRKWGQEWDLDLRVDKKFAEDYGLPIKLEFHSQVQAPVVSIFTNVLALETHFELAQGIDFAQSLKCPEPIKFQYSCIKESFCHDLHYFVEKEQVDLDNILACPKSPEETERAFLQLLNMSHENENEQYFMFNRQHTFFKGWQKHDANWMQVCTCLPETDDIYKRGIE